MNGRDKEIKQVAELVARARKTGIEGLSDDDLQALIRTQHKPFYPPQLDQWRAWCKMYAALLYGQRHGKEREMSAPAISATGYAGPRDDETRQREEELGGAARNTIHWSAYVRANPNALERHIEERKKDAALSEKLARKVAGREIKRAIRSGKIRHQKDRIEGQTIIKWAAGKAAKHLEGYAVSTIENKLNGIVREAFAEVEAPGFERDAPGVITHRIK